MSGTGKNGVGILLGSFLHIGLEFSWVFAIVPPQ